MLNAMHFDQVSDVDWTILMPERSCGSKLEGRFKKIKARVIDETRHTITIMPGKGKSNVVSKTNLPSRSLMKQNRKEEHRQHDKFQVLDERKMKKAVQMKMPNIGETPIAMRRRMRRKIGTPLKNNLSKMKKLPQKKRKKQVL